jgi:hypothetical protein
METTKENFKKDLQALLDGYVVADSHGNIWLAADINIVKTYVWCGLGSKRTDWPVTDLTIQQDILGVPGESGDEHTVLCRYSLNSDCLTPYAAEDFQYNEVGFIARTD